VHAGEILKPKTFTTILQQAGMDVDELVAVL
jgi:predicted RNA binding protein YcfA (HicA-like mRNA interferase family)